MFLHLQMTLKGGSRRVMPARLREREQKRSVEPKQSCWTTTDTGLFMDQMDPSSDVELPREVFWLHVIRVVALYLCAVFAQDPMAVEQLVTESQLAVHWDIDVVAPLHRVLQQCVQHEARSNQFEGIIDEQRVFTVLHRFFQARKVTVAHQCQTLMRLLALYMKELTQTPILHCQSNDVLGYTLEYLSAAEPWTAPCSPALLYPIVDAVDSLRIEQRECLDALVCMWKWLLSSQLTAQERYAGIGAICHFHHEAVLHVELHGNPSSEKANRGQPLTQRWAECFIRTLIENSSHVFRREGDLEIDSTCWMQVEPERQGEMPNVDRLDKSRQRPKIEQRTEAQPEDEPVHEEENGLPAAFLAAAAGTLAAALCVFCY